MKYSVLFPFQLTSATTLTEVATVTKEHDFDHLWLTQSFGIDIFTAIAVAATRVPDIRFGSAVALMPLYHPIELATRVRALADVCPGRFVLGLGMSEPSVVRDVLGGIYPHSPLTYTREYMSILDAMLHSENAKEFRGEYFSGWTNTLGGHAFTALNTPPQFFLADSDPK